MAARPIEQALARLMPDGTPRVWSLVVTLFGDLARTEGDRLSGAALAHLTGRLGVRSEALRVALHRLRNDGWIESHKRGRSSDYALTQHGLSQSRAARDRIYARDGAPDGDWHLVLAGGPGAAAAVARLGRLERTVELGGAALLIDGAPAADLGDTFLCARVEGDLPAWLRTALLPDPLRQQIDRLEAALRGLPTLIGDAPSVTDRALLRVLIVHEWRRIALRLPPLPDRFMPEGWTGPTCRTRVADLLEQLPAPRPDEIEAAASASAG